jgi:DNA-binding NtrC family response regulator
MPELKPARGTVLVVEDESYVRTSLGELLGSRGFDVILASGVAEAQDHLGRAPVDLVLTDLKMPGTDGLELVRRLHASFPDLPVLVLTGHGTIASAVECIKAGAADYVLKPADPDALELALARALERRALQREVSYLRAAGAQGTVAPEPLGQSALWRKTLESARSAAPTGATVLLLGESGTGKELVARKIHRLSARSRGPYIRVNCAAVPLEMWESEFFGHRKGSYTGAIADREGWFRLAHLGTLFMDEVGAMPPSAQAKILRALQDGEFHRLGEEQPTRVDVRVVAATNADLEEEVRAGRFRQDLYYRLNVVRIELPPLRSRIEDIPLLASAFLREISARLGRTTPTLSQRAMGELTAYRWPGNVRELRNALERALILTTGEILDSLDLSSLAGELISAASLPESDSLNLRAALARREKEVLLDALKRSGGVRKEAARLLGIDQRNLGYYLHKHGIDPDRLTE